MPFGLLTGLGAALAWGTLDIVTALTSRVIGSLRVTAGMQLVTAVLFAILFVVTGATLPDDPGTIAISILLGFIGAGAYLAYFTGLQYGPISVVSGVVAAFGGLTVVLSVVFRGESLTTLQAAGAAIATMGVVLTGLAFDGGWRSTRFAGPGVIFSVVALILFALMTMATDIALELTGWVQVYLVARTVNAAIAIVTVIALSTVATRFGPAPDGRPGLVEPAGRRRPHRRRRPRRARPHLVRRRPRVGADVDGRSRGVVRTGGDDRRRRGAPG